MFIIIIIIIPLFSRGLWGVLGQVSLDGVFSVPVSGLAAWNMGYRIVANGGGVMPHTKSRLSYEFSDMQTRLFLKPPEARFLFLLFDAQAARFAN